MDCTLADPIKEALHKAIDDSDTGYAGLTEVGDVFREFAAREWDWEFTGKLAVSTDVGTAVPAVMREVLPAGAKVIITTPVYPSFFGYFNTIGAQPLPVPLVDVEHGGRLDLDGIERAMASGADGLLLANPHNPTGRVHTRDELIALADLADRYDIPVFSDEIHAPLVFSGESFTPYLPLTEGRTHQAYAFHSASKAWNLAGLKCGFALGRTLPAALRADEPAWAAGQMGVIATIAAYRHGMPWLQQLRAELQANAALLAELLAEHLPQIGYYPPSASFLAWLDCRELGLGDDPAAAFLDRGKVALNSGPAFGDEGMGCARLNIGTSPQVLREAVRRLARAIA
jgi:cystathionine beta-lyase